MKKIIQSVGKVKEKDFNGSMVSGQAAGASTQEHETPCDVYHGLTDAFKEVGIQPSSQCKLPRTYGYGYEKLPDFVEADPGPLKPEEIDNTDWSDGAAASDGPKDKFKPVPVIRAGGSCNFYILPDEKICQCPYDRSHQLLEPRFKQHLVKCRANYIKTRAKAGKDIEMEICKFDIMHHILKSCMAEHVKVCPNALEAAQSKKNLDKLFEKSRADGNGKADTSCSEANSCGKSSVSDVYDKKDVGKVFDENENWEQARPVSAYDPAVKLNQSASLFYNPQGMTKSEHKKYRQDTAIRHANEDGLKKTQQPNVDFAECFPKDDVDNDEVSFEESGDAEQEEDDDDGNVEK